LLKEIKIENNIKENIKRVLGKACRQ